MTFPRSTAGYFISLKVIGFLLGQLNSGYSSANCSRFVTMSDCACLGQTLLYQCTIQGAASTLWSGTAFNCISNSISLRHSQYPNDASGVCSDGSIRGSSLRVDGDCYTSQLDVTLSSSLNGRSVQCSSNVGQISGTNDISITTEPYPPPIDVRLAVVHPGYLAFTWSPLQVNCLSVHYNIIARNCGIMCPSSTTHGTTTCTGGVIQENPCIFSFAVQTVVCGNIVSNTSNQVSVTLRGPRPPTFHCEPQYSADSGFLRRITTTFEKVDSFNISEGIEERVSLYTISYFHARDATICGYATVPAVSCLEGMCTHTFEVSASMCSPFSNINVTVFSTSQLGNGSISAPVAVEFINHYFGIKVDLLMSSIHCIFSDRQDSNEISCGVAMSPRSEGTCVTNLLYESENRKLTSNSVISVDLPELPPSPTNIFCYVVTARNGTFTAKIEGTFNAGCNQKQLSDGTTLPENVKCGAPFHSLGIKNGAVCFNSINVGAVAVYFCHSGCGSSSTYTLSARTCLDNGTWNGTIPECEVECDDNILTFGTQTVHDGKIHHFNTLVMAAALIGLVLIVVIIFFVVVLAILIRAKSKLQDELRQSQASALYKEIVLPPAVIDSTKNVAYASTVNEKTESITKFSHNPSSL